MPTELDDAPFIVIWETTRACALACVHCRASAQLEPLPGELSHEEATALIDEIAAMGTKVLVFSGGDPLMRADLAPLIRHAKARGLRAATVPAATPRLTKAALQELKDAGVDQIAFSLDASTAEQHDGIRRVAGAYAITMQAAAWAHEVGLPLQINTVMSARNAGDFEAMVRLVQRLGIVFWEVFFLVPVGRGAEVGSLTAEQFEQRFARLLALEDTGQFVVKVTEAPHYRRYVAQHRRGRQAVAGHGGSGSGRPPHGTPPSGARPAIGLASRSINAGKGHCFIAYNGDVCPSGFLPVVVGNIRETPLQALYRTAPLFLALRDPAQLKGKCGACEYRELCSGSRARAYAVTGDPLAEEPCCVYTPLRRHPAPTSA